MFAHLSRGNRFRNTFLVFGANIDTQTIELVGQHRLASELLQSGLEVVFPAQDHGVDLIAYTDLDQQVGLCGGADPDESCVSSIVWNLEEVPTDSRPDFGFRVALRRCTGSPDIRPHL